MIGMIFFFFQVEATHTYTGEDVDELSFEPGDIIYVVPFDNEEEQVGTEYYRPPACQGVLESHEKYCKFCVRSV